MSLTKENASALPPSDRDDLAPGVRMQALATTGESEMEVIAPGEELPEMNWRGINIGGNTVTQCTEHLPEEQRLLVRWLHTHARNQNWDWPTLEKALQIDKSTGYRIFTDTYRYPQFQYSAERQNGKPVKVKTAHPKAGQRVSLEAVCQKIARFKAVFDEREAMKHSGFVETTVWERISWLCEKVYVRQKMGFIFSDSQEGKSTCLEEFQRRNNHGQTTYVELPPAAGVQLMTKCIAKSLHVSTGTCYEKLIDDVVAALDPSKLLIVDEVHRVFTTYQKTSVMRCLDVIRYIHDKTHCGVVLCGTNVFRDRMQQGEFFQYLKQLHRRGLYILQFDGVVQEDLRRVSASFGMPMPNGAALEKLRDIASVGGIGTVFTRLVDAKDMARKESGKLAWGHFMDACDIVNGMATGKARK